MKKLLLIPLVITLLNTGCEKEPSIEAVNIAPMAFAGTDFRVRLPAESATLIGSYYDTPSDIVTHSWRKISGPSNYVIEKPESLKTKVLNLVQGVYEFELSVSDKGGLTGKDTVTLYVYDPRNPGSNEFIFKSLVWMCPMGCTLNIENFNNYVLPLTPVQVFLEDGNSNVWIKVPHVNLWTAMEKYVWGRSYGGLWIYSNEDQQGSNNVKIIF